MHCKLKESSTICQQKTALTTSPHPLPSSQCQCLRPAALIQEIKFNTYDVIFESAAFQQKGDEVYPVFLKNQTI